MLLAITRCVAAGLKSFALSGRPAASTCEYFLVFKKQGYSFKKLT